jgi:hypothetical protein
MVNPVTIIKAGKLLVKVFRGDTAKQSTKLYHKRFL